MNLEFTRAAIEAVRAHDNYWEQSLAADKDMTRLAERFRKAAALLGVSALAVLGEGVAPSQILADAEAPKKKPSKRAKAAK